MIDENIFDSSCFVFIIVYIRSFFRCNRREVIEIFQVLQLMSYKIEGTKCLTQQFCTIYNPHNYFISPKNLWNFEKILHSIKSQRK